MEKESDTVECQSCGGTGRSADGEMYPDGSGLLADCDICWGRGVVPKGKFDPPLTPDSQP
jgi:DnaJ-class molecular chaperone